MTLGREPAVEHVHVEGDAHLELGLAEERLHQHFRIDVAALGLEHETDVVGRFVAHVGEQRQLALQEKLGDALDEPRLLHLIGNLADDDLIDPALELLGMPARAQAKAAAPARVSRNDALARLDEHAARGQVRARDEAHERVDARLGMVDQVEEGICELAHVVRRDARRHADGNALGAVRKQVREIGRQYDRLLALSVIGRAEIDRVLVDAVEQELGHGGHARLRVAHGRGVVAVDVAEIALAVDEGIARGELLGQTHEGVVDRGVAVGVILAHHVADDARAFLEALVGIEAQLAHRMQEPAMHRLEPVAHVGQRARHDGRERVGEIALAERIRELGGANLSRAWSIGHKLSSMTPDIVAGLTVPSIARRRWSGIARAGAALAERAAQALEQVGARLGQFAVEACEDVALEEMAGQAQAVKDVAVGGRLAGLGQEARQAEEAVLVRLARRERDGAAGARRDVEELVVTAGRGASGEIEAEAELGEKAELPGDLRAAPAGDALARLEGCDEGDEAVEDGRVRLALGKGRLCESNACGKGREAQGIVEECRGPALYELAGVAAEMLGEPRAPHGLDPVAGLQHAARFRTRPAVHEPGMAPMVSRQELRDRSTLSVLPRREHDPFVAPFHGTGLAQGAGGGERKERAPAPAEPSISPRRSLPWRRAREPRPNARHPRAAGRPAHPGVPRR